MKKAQTISIDMVFGFFIFLLFIIVSLYIWNIYTLRYSYYVEDNEKRLVAYEVSDLLLRQPGIPGQWETMPLDNVSVLGLAWNDHNLSQEKIDAFLQQSNGSYDKIKKLLNIERFDYLFRVVDPDRSTITGNITGKYYYENRTVTIRRVAVIGDDIRFIEISIF